MKRAVQWMALICMVMLGTSVICVSRHLPPDNQPLIEEKYSGWSGVLRVWIYEGWTDDTDAFAGWLNRCGALFEKKHNGIYVQVRYVAAEAIASMEESGLVPPDVILFPPGLLESSDGLLPLPDVTVRAPFNRSACAVPVAAGGYAWIVNPSAEGGAVLLPPDSAYRSWSAAVLALGAIDTEKPQDEIELPGIDLGLPAMTDSVPSFVGDASAAKTFSRGEAWAMPAAQDGIRRLERIGERQSVPGWTLLTGDVSFTDQLLLAAALPGDAQRAAISREYILHLLSDACQALLTDADFFPVTDLPAAYSADDPLALIDASLRRENTVIVPFFENGWRKGCANRLKNAGNPNNPSGFPFEMFTFDH